MDKYIGNVRRMTQNVLPRRRLAGRILLWGLLLIVVIGGTASWLAVAAARPVIGHILLSPDSVTVYSVEELATAAGVKIGMPLHTKTKREITSAIVDEYPDLLMVKTQKNSNDGTIVLKITEKQPFFYVVTGSDFWLTDASLMLLRPVSSTDEMNGLIRLSVPEDAFSGAGEKLNLGDDASYYQSYINAILACDLHESVTGISLKKRYDLKIMIDDRIVLCWGTADQTDVKTALCLAMLEDSMFGTGLFATADVSDPARAVARPLYYAEEVLSAFYES